MSKDHQNDFFDSHIKYAGREMFIKLTKEAPTEEELADFEIPSDNIDKRITSVINKEVRKKRTKRALRITSRIAAGLLVLIIVFSITIASSNALRTRFFNLFKTSNNISDTININNSDEVKDAITPGYLPEGYHFASGSENEITSLSIYEDSEGDTIFISRYKSLDIVTYDTENSSAYETTINGNKVLVIEQSEINNVYYFETTYIYKLVGIVDVEELIAIIDSLPE